MMLRNANRKRVKSQTTADSELKLKLQRYALILI